MAPQPVLQRRYGAMRIRARVSGDSSPPPSACERPSRLPTPPPSVSNHGRPEGRRSAGAHARLPRRRHQAGIFAVVAFVDGIRAQPAQSRFCGLAPPPLQEELFGHHVAGEVFSKPPGSVGKTDSPDLADLLESTSCAFCWVSPAATAWAARRAAAVCEAVAEKIRRIRGRRRNLSGVGAAAGSGPRAGTDPLVQTFGMPPRLAVCWR